MNSLKKKRHSITRLKIIGTGNVITYVPYNIVKSHAEPANDNKPKNALMLHVGIQQ
jgi:hypothetical protein